ncbi:MAG TPA: DUF2336 domain-containing protein [Xanthobacteraceae bacterium]|nr:DUF2336 domain-containing protein [Xanthobacteraceae bacterium]
MTERDSKLTELENLLRRVPPAKRPALLKSLADLFIENAERYRPAQLNLFDRLFSLLIAEVGKETMAALARRLAPLATAPFLTVNRLALDDDITVAEPVLLHSSCIENSVLMEIAHTRGQTHLLALACRSPLPEPLADLLVARGDDVVLRYVANNREARLSPQSAAQLVARARYDSLLARLLRQRADIPARLLADLPMPAQAAAG